MHKSKINCCWPVCFYLLLFHTGCAQNSPIPPADAISPAFGEIAVVPVRVRPSYNFDTFACNIAERAGQEILEGMLGGFYGAMCLAGLDPFAILLLPVFVTGGGLIGAIHGLANTPPDKQFGQIEWRFNRAIEAFDIQNTLARHVIAQAAAGNKFRFHLHPEYGPYSLESTGMGYQISTDHPIDAILELAVLEVNFEGISGLNQSISLAMTVRVRLIRLRDDNVVYSDRFEYRGKGRPLASWARNDPNLLRNEFTRCYRDLAQRIMETVFL